MIENASGKCASCDHGRLQLSETDERYKGHEFGDMLLQSVADGIEAVLSEKCIAMRVGGDEIFMVCPHTSKEKAEVLVQKMKEQMVKRSDEILQVSVYFGISTVENGEATFEEADQEMYKEKMASRDGRE
ncbi:MAG: diguanylate cyclase domain-containing protein [Roseburia faecis]